MPNLYSRKNVSFSSFFALLEMSVESEYVVTDVKQIPQYVTNLRATFRTGKTLEYKWRIEQLKQLRRLISEGRERLSQAMWKDLHRSRMETYLLELSTVEADINATIEHLSSWMTPERVSTNLSNFPGSSYIQSDPLGVVLIMSPWNYPIQLFLSPLVGAIAAGNCVVLRPADYTHNVSAVLSDLVHEYLDPECFRVVTGGREVTTAVLAQRFDLIFFTGGPTLGRIVHLAANKYLTPVILELGGKSPSYVHRDADLEISARRLAWSVFLNAGQTCVRPDYLLVHRDIASRFLDKLRSNIIELYTSECSDAREYGFQPSTDSVENAALAAETPAEYLPGVKPSSSAYDQTSLTMIQKSPYFGRIVDGGSAFDRLVKIVEDDVAYVTVGGAVNRESRFMAPTILNFGSDKEAFATSSSMQVEIFGPILPVLTVQDEEEALQFITDREHPLASYCFTTSSAVKAKFAKRTTSGSLVFNDAIVQLANHHLPFGGVGASGMGNYHGKFSFDTFSHQKSVLYKTNMLDLAARYPPYSTTKEKVLKLVNMHIPDSAIAVGVTVVAAAVVTAVVLGTKKYWS